MCGRYRTIGSPRNHNYIHTLSRENTVNKRSFLLSKHFWEISDALILKEDNVCMHIFTLGWICKLYKNINPKRW